jgi:hypothetical protein
MGRARSAVAVLALTVAVTGILAASAASTSVTTGTSGWPIPQGDQADAAYGMSSAGVSNVFATTQQTSCFTPEVPYFTNLGPALGYTGMTRCGGNTATTGEDVGPYPSQTGSNPGYPADSPMLVKDHSESDIRVDPTNSDHIIGTSKWFTSAEGYNHQLGFYESRDGGQTWNVQGHIPGFEGWTDGTDPVGAFDTYGNFWFFDLAYQFFYDKNEGHNFTVGKSQEPNPLLPAEVVGVTMRPHGATTATDWTTPEIVAAYDSKGNEPDKQWITVDTGAASPFKNRIYTMWVNFHTLTPVPYVSYSQVTAAGGAHTAWSTPRKLPEPAHVPQGSTYLLPHVAPDGTVYTTVTNFNPAHQFGAPAVTFIDKSTDGGATWTTLPGTITIPNVPPLEFANTTFRDGITDTFAIGPSLDSRHQYPLYLAYEDYGAGVDNVLFTASYDGGQTWASPIQVNDNSTRVDEFQPNLSVAPDGTVSVAWYDRRLRCAASGSAEAAAAGITAFDPTAAGRSNYCVDASVQFYGADLTPIGHNVRLTQHAWDPQLNAPHPGGAFDSETFIGDYFGNDASVGTTDWFTFVSTYNPGNANPQNYQQQVVAKVTTP